MIRTAFLLAGLLFRVYVTGAATVPLWPGYVDSGFNREQVREIRFAEDCRAIVLAPAVEEFRPEKPTLLIVYATPNGNTAEQTLGCQLVEGLDWHFDIQHVAAQWRAFRKLEAERNVVLACVQANNLSWPTWKSERPPGPRYIRQIVESLAASIPAKAVRVVLTGHSGGGSFIFGFLDADEEIPAAIERIAFLDANYGYDTAQGHGDKILQWLDAAESRRFVTIAYDDRNIELDGKKVVSPTGGTYRATDRMLVFLREHSAVEESDRGDFHCYSAANGQLVVLVHANPENIILHTRLVGEMNGLLEALTAGTALHGKWGKLAPPRAYVEFLQPKPLQPTDWHPRAPALPLRSAGTDSGSEIVEKLLDEKAERREQVIAKEILQGNVPNFWRQFVDVSVAAKDNDGQSHTIVYRVSPDYLAIGSDDDFVRVPLTPYVAQQIADVAGCLLPTRKMVNEIYNAATAKLTPQPLTEDRESLATFAEHNRLIQQQCERNKPGRLIAGIKKDVVVTDKLLERPDRVAIYGWHKLDGEPIQPLTTVHVDWYVDYSHGIRLVDQWCEVDGHPKQVEEVLRDKNLHLLLSDEGPLECTRYRHAAKKPD